MGYTHAATGAVGWLLVAPAAARMADHPLTLQELLIGLAVCAGAALLPDIDHPQATVSRTFGPISQAVAKLTAAISGGHRHATHSFFFCALMGAIVWLFSMMFPFKGFIAATVFIMSAFALRGLHLTPPKVSGTIKNIIVLIEAGLLTWWAMQPGTIGSWWWLAPAVTLGCFIHIMGDSCTPERCPWFWPHKKRWGVGIIEETGNFAETKILAPICVLFAFILFYINLVKPLNLPWLNWLP